MLGLHCFTQAFPSRGELFTVVQVLLIAVFALVSEHRLQAHDLQ